jgi:hypothetical protein
MVKCPKCGTENTKLDRKIETKFSRYRSIPVINAKLDLNPKAKTYHKRINGLSFKLKR